MLGLTLLRPWDAAMVYLGKDIENRKWRPSEKVRGQRIALHAGKGWDATSILFIEKHAAGDRVGLFRRIEESERRHSAIVGTVRVVDWYRYADAAGASQPSQQWAFGPWCWRLADVIALPEPVPCKGALGLWKLPPDVEAKVLEQEARAA